MKWFTVVSIVSLAALSTLSAPNTAHAQWVKGMTRIKSYPYFNDPNISQPLDVKGDSHYTPGSGTDIANVFSPSASSQRGDNEDSAYVKNLNYTAVQDFEWSFAMAGPPSSGFTTDASASIGGAVGPSKASVPANAPPEQQIGRASCLIAVGNLSGAGGNARPTQGGGPSEISDSFQAPIYGRTTAVRVEHQTEPTPNIYHAEFAIGMRVETIADFVIATEDVEPIGGGGGVAFRPTFLGKHGFFCPSSSQMTFYGKACQAECHGTLSFSNPYPTP